jgi:hypothetical protein
VPDFLVDLLEALPVACGVIHTHAGWLVVQVNPGAIPGPDVDVLGAGTHLVAVLRAAQANL